MTGDKPAGIRGSLLILLSISGFALVVASSFGNQIEWLPPNVLFGLFGMMPFTYWLGIGVMASSLLLGLRGTDVKVFAVQFLLIYLALWSAPALFERYPSVWDSYMHYSSTVTIMQSGSSLTEGMFSYPANYPGFFVLNAAFSLLGNPPVLDMLRFYPLAIALFTFVALYLTVRTFVPNVGPHVALVLSALGNVWVQYSFSPQSLGLVTALLIFVFLEKGGVRWTLMALAAFAYLTISHPTSMFIVAGVLILREIIVRLRAFRAKDRLGERTWPISAFIIVWVLWLITGARMYSWFLGSLVYQKLLYIFYLPTAVSNTAFMRTAGNIFPYSSLLRTALLGTFFLLFFIAIVLPFLRRRKQGKERRFSKACAISLVLVPLVIAPLDIFFLQGSIYDRAILFFALAAPLFFVPVLIRERKRVFVALMMLAVLMAAVCSFTAMYQESLYVVSDRSLQASDFLSQAMSDGSTVIGGHYPYVVWREDNQTYLRAEYYSVYKTPFGNLTRDGGPTAMIFDRTTELWHLQWGTIELYDFYADEIGNYSKVLDNGAYAVIYGGASGA